jgi:hypothetical protein
MQINKIEIQEKKRRIFRLSAFCVLAFSNDPVNVHHKYSVARDRFRYNKEPRFDIGGPI